MRHGHATTRPCTRARRAVYLQRPWIVSCHRGRWRSAGILRAWPSSCTYRQGTCLARYSLLGSCPFARGEKARAAHPNGVVSSRSMERSLGADRPVLRYRRCQGIIRRTHESSARQDRAGRPLPAPLRRQPLRHSWLAHAFSSGRQGGEGRQERQGDENQAAVAAAHFSAPISPFLP